MAETARASTLPELERYTLGALIGRGSMGAVYEATDDEGRVVAIKIIHAEVAEHDMALTRFEREVELARRIDHPAVPTIFDHGQLPDGRLFLAMERLHGESLEDWWDIPRPLLDAMDLLLEALGPLAAAHRLGIVHRDLKPENVFVLDGEGSGRVRLLDFGIARDVDTEAKGKTATGVAVGTPVYMSPEQATKPRTASFPTDVWSFGVMMYEALCGELPFDGDTPHAVIIAVATEAHVPLRERAPDVHPALVELVERCLDKNPSRRPADAGELEALLRALLERGDVRASLVGTAAAPPFRLSVERAGRSEETLEESATPSSSGLRRLEPAKRRRPLWIAAALLLLGAVGVGLAWSRTEEPVTAAEPPRTAEASESPSEAPSAPPSEEAPSDGSWEDDELGPEPELSVALTEEATGERSNGNDEPSGEARDPSPRPATLRSTGMGPRVARASGASAETDSEAPVDSAANAAPAPPEPTPAADEEAVVAAAPAPPPTMETATDTATAPPAEPAPAVAPAAPSTPRTVRRVVRRRAEPAPTRPGFVTF